LRKGPKEKIPTDVKKKRKVERHHRTAQKRMVDELRGGGQGGKSKTRRA